MHSTKRDEAQESEGQGGLGSRVTVTSCLGVRAAGGQARSGRVLVDVHVYSVIRGSFGEGC